MDQRAVRRLIKPILLTLVASSASPQAPRIELRLKEKIIVRKAAPGGLVVRGPARCDGRGNLYLRFYGGPKVEPPVVKVTHEGAMGTNFAIRSVPGFEKGVARDFTVTVGGEIYLLAARRVGEQEIVELQEDGKFASSFRIQSNLDAQQVAAFPSGELLIAGAELAAEGGLPTGRPLLALYDGSGEFVREISLPRDVQFQKQEEAADDTAESWVSLSNAEAADDGNVYMLRPGPVPTVYVISPAGAVLRRLEIAPPGEGFEAGMLKVAGGQIAIEFYADNPKGPGSIFVYSVVGTDDGVKVADYVEPKEAGGIWSCYTPDGWTFLSSEGTPPKMTLVRASPR